MTNQLSRIAIVVCAMTLTAGCFGTEGGNPLDPHDAGPGRPDGGLGCDDAGTPTRGPVCEPDSSSPECACDIGDPVALSTQPGGVGQSARLVGPTPSGGFVALHRHTCVEGCTDTTRAVLDAIRFEADLARVGDAIEVTRSFGQTDFGAAVHGSSLALAWADERSGPSGVMNIWFGELDLDTGAWTIAPHLAISVDAPIFGVGLAKGTSGFGVVYHRVINVYTPPPDESSFFARLDDSGALIGEPARIGPSNDGYNASTSIVPHADGYALARWNGETLVFHLLGANGSVGAPLTIAENRGQHRRGGVMMRASGSGYAVAWTDAVGLRFVRTDANGAITGTPVDLGAGDIADMAVETGGTIVLLWTPMAACGFAPGWSPEGIMLTRLDGESARVQPDVVVRRIAEELDAYGTAVTDTPAGLRVAYRETATSTQWIVPACAR